MSKKILSLVQSVYVDGEEKSVNGLVELVDFLQVNYLIDICVAR